MSKLLKNQTVKEKPNRYVSKNAPPLRVSIVRELLFKHGSAGMAILNQAIKRLTEVRSHAS